MNGVPLPDKHGAPVRIVAPGIAGARSVKWLEKITVQATESDNFYQYHDYKVLPPEATNMEEANKYWHKTPALQDMPINSVIGSPQTGDTVKTDTYGKIEVSGYALPRGAGGPVVRVEVSIDEGKSWGNAEILGNPSKWSWALWKAHVAVQKGKNRRILSRTTDRSGNVQRDDSQWNLRGVAYNGYGEVRDVEVV
jgi:sulfite oxidase